MLDSTFYTAIAHSPDDVLAPAMKAVRPRLASSLGARVSELFPELGRAFPLTVAAMEEGWSRPALALKDMGRDWLATLLLERDGLNLFLNNPFPLYAEWSDFDELHSGLPAPWVNFYRWIESFVITEKSSYSPLGWPNTLLPRPIDANMFSAETFVKKAKIKAFSKQLGMRRHEDLECYLFTDDGESLWVNGQHRDKKVHHVRGDDFGNAYVLPNPGVALDNYLAHVVSGGRPGEFDFRTCR